MEEEKTILLSSRVASLKHSRESLSTIKFNKEPFLDVFVISQLSFQDQSTIYCSLITLVKARHPFDNALQLRAARFLKSLEPKWSYDKDLPTKIVTRLVHSSDDSPSGFTESILTLLSSPHSTVVAAALSFLKSTTKELSPAIRCLLVEPDLIANLLATVQPRALPISGNETILSNIMEIIVNCLSLASLSYLRDLGMTCAIDAFNHRDMIFQKVVIPSSQFVSFLITNRYILNECLSESFVNLLRELLRMSPPHRPTLEYVLASPIVMGFSTCYSFFENNEHLWVALNRISYSFKEWKKEGPEAVQCGKELMQTLFSEGFEDTLEQILKNAKKGNYPSLLVSECHLFSQLLGSNVKE